MKAKITSVVLRALFLVMMILLLSVFINAILYKDSSDSSVRNLKLKVSENGRYFTDQYGKPFFYLGETCWLLFKRFNHEELEEYLNDRVSKGFTVMQAYVLRGLGNKATEGNLSLSEIPPLLDRDPTRPNEEYFKNVDYVINRANDLGLVMGLVVSKSWHVEEHPEKVFDEKNAYTFGRFLGERYKNNAVIWFVGGDSPPEKYEAVWVSMAKGLKDGSENRQMVCYHGQGSTSSSMWFHKAGWLDFNSIQSGHRYESDSYAFVSKDYALTPVKPTLDMEPSYENHPTGENKPRINSHKVRTQAYAAMLAGAAGHGYGSLDLFYLYKDEDGPFPKDGFQHWRTAMTYEGSRQVRLMRRLFEQLPWYKLVPDQSIIVSDPGDGPYRSAAARAEDGSFVVAYTPYGKVLSIDMSKLSGRKVKARWYDPRDGSWLKIGKFVNKGFKEFPAPSQGVTNDWVLVLDSKP